MVQENLAVEIIDDGSEAMEVSTESFGCCIIAFLITGPY